MELVDNSFAEKIPDNRVFSIRVQDSGTFTRNNMFHVPFHLQNKAATQEYIIKNRLP